MPCAQFGAGDVAIAVGVDGIEVLEQAVLAIAPAARGSHFLTAQPAVAVAVEALGATEAAAMAAVAVPALALLAAARTLAGVELAVAVLVQPVEMLGKAREFRGFGTVDRAIAVGIDVRARRPFLPGLGRLRDGGGRAQRQHDGGGQGLLHHHRVLEGGTSAAGASINAQPPAPLTACPGFRPRTVARRAPRDRPQYAGAVPGSASRWATTTTCGCSTPATTPAVTGPNAWRATSCSIRRIRAWARPIRKPCSGALPFRRHPLPPALRRLPRACVAVRIPIASFVPSRAQKRCIARNADVTARILPAERNDERLVLYRRYLRIAIPRAAWIRTAPASSTSS